MELSTFAMNIGAALLMGVVIGLERQWRQHPAGLRTNTLVALGAALFVSLSLLMGEANSPTRMASYVVSGLGFLGGGVILRDGLNVKGLNTAATLWCSGAVGTLSGSGFPLHALLGTACILGIHLSLRPVVMWIDNRTKMTAELETCYRLRVECETGHQAHLRHTLLKRLGGHKDLRLHGLSTQDGDGKTTVVLADIFVSKRNDKAMEEIVAVVSLEAHVKGVSWQMTVAT